MNISNFLNDGLTFLNVAGGIQTSVTKYNSTINDSDYDDVVTYQVTGSTTFSGLIFPIHSKQGSNEALLLEQGKLLTQDKVVYCGSINLNSSGNVFLINSVYYSLIDNGMTRYDVAGSTIYNKLYVRNLNGSVLF